MLSLESVGSQDVVLGLQVVKSALMCFLKAGTRLSACL